MPLNETMIHARNLLLELLVFLSIGESCWYAINGGPPEEYSLARRLGFFREEEYYAFLSVADFVLKNVPFLSFVRL
jgi:hypothetical protein